MKVFTNLTKSGTQQLKEVINFSAASDGTFYNLILK